MNPPIRMHSYSLYNLCVHSDIAFDDLPGGGEVADATIRLTKLDQSVLAAGERNGNRVTGRLHYDPLESDVLFEIKNGRSIALDPLAPIDPDVLKGWLTGVFMSVLLRQRGYLVLHASAVVKDGQAVAFMGESGWGKSTIAEYLHQQGYDLLTDDVLVLDIPKDGEGVSVLPGHRFIRLREEAGREFVGTFEALPRVNPYTTKRVRIVEDGPDRPIPLRKLYALENVAAAAYSVEPIPAQMALLRLLGNARSKDLLSSPAFQASLMKQCAALVGRVPVALLHRRRGLDTFPELQRAVEEDLAGGGNGAAVSHHAAAGR